LHGQNLKKEEQNRGSTHLPLPFLPPSLFPLDYSDGAEDETARGPNGRLIQAKTLSLLQRKQQMPTSMITWGKEDGGHLFPSPSSLPSSPPRIESEEESYLWSLTVLQLRDLLREKSMPVSGVKAALVARLMEVPVMEEEGREEAQR